MNEPSGSLDKIMNMKSQNLIDIRLGLNWGVLLTPESGRLLDYYLGDPRELLLASFFCLSLATGILIYQSIVTRGNHLEIRFISVSVAVAVLIFGTLTVTRSYAAIIILVLAVGVPILITTVIIGHLSRIPV